MLGIVWNTPSSFEDGYTPGMFSKTVTYPDDKTAVLLGYVRRWATLKSVFTFGDTFSYTRPVWNMFSINENRDLLVDHNLIPDINCKHL